MINNREVINNVYIYLTKIYNFIVYTKLYIVIIIKKSSIVNYFM
jgi:hypothetical protein